MGFCDLRQRFPPFTVFTSGEFAQPNATPDCPDDRHLRSRPRPDRPRQREILKREELEARLKLGARCGSRPGSTRPRPTCTWATPCCSNKMRQFQDLGHQVIFLIGDFTGMIGDPTGKNVTRKPLTREDVLANAGPTPTRCSRCSIANAPSCASTANGSAAMSAADMIRSPRQHTVARMLERDDFAKRHAAQQSIAIHEFLYPLVQGYDSVALRRTSSSAAPTRSSTC